MKKKLKYDAPLCDEFAVILEGVVAQSPGYSGTVSNPFGGTPDEEELEDWG